MSSRVIAARLSEKIEKEREALEVYQRWLDKGNTPRDVVTAAMLALAGYPVIESNEVSAMRRLIEDFQAALTETLVKLLEEKMDELAAMTPVERRRAVDDAAKSTFRKSILDSVDVADFEEEDGG